MTNNAVELAKTGARFRAEEYRERRRDRRPSFTREVLAPWLLVSLSCGGIVAGLMLAWHYTGKDTIVAVFWLSIAVAAFGGLAAFAYTLPHYWYLQDPLTLDAVYDVDGVDDAPAQRAVVRSGRNSAAVFGHYWRRGWQKSLARKTHDASGQWTGPDAVSRRLLAGLIRSLPDNYPAALKDLERAGWIDNDNDKNFTGNARAELRAALNFPSGG